jgi:hypothetical protein
LGGVVALADNATTHHEADALELVTSESGLSAAPRVAGSGVAGVCALQTELTNIATKPT